MNVKQNVNINVKNNVNNVRLYGMLYKISKKNWHRYCIYKNRTRHRIKRGRKKEGLPQQKTIGGRYKKGDNMNILVCIKQVPDTTSIKIDPVRNTLIRDGVPSIVNPFDGYALEAAARIKDKDPETKIVVMSMGPEQAKNALKECLAIAADKAYLVSGRKFGGSDTLATSFIISEAIKMVEEKEGCKFDAIFCGKQAIDGDTGQVGPEIAEYYGYPQVTYGLEAEAADGMLKVKKETEEGAEIIGIRTPCVVTFTKPSFDPRFPTIKRRMAANRAEIPVISDSDLVLDETRIGLKGSPTKVKKTFVPQKKQGGMKIKEGTYADSAKKLFTVLNDAGVI